MVGHSSPSQVHRTVAADREDESTSSTAEESSPSSPSHPQRSAPCRLFIASSDHLQQPRCVICGFHELDHSVRVHRRPAAGQVQSHEPDGNDQNRSSSRHCPSEEQPLRDGRAVRHCDSDWNVLEDDQPKSVNKRIAPGQWRNSYDVRGEYLSKEDFRAKYSNYFKASSFDTNRASEQSEDGCQRKFYYPRPLTTSNVYYYTDRGQIDDSGGDTDIEQKPVNWSVPSYWSDTEAIRQPNPTSSHPFPLITFRPLAATKTSQQRHSASLALPLTNPLAVLSQDLNQNQPSSDMFALAKQEPRHSSLIDYLTTFTSKNQSSENPVVKTKKKVSVASVSFRPQAAIIGHDGGAEHFLRSDSSDGSSTLDGENGDEEDEVIWTVDTKTELEMMTEINTEFNADRRNFVAEEAREKADAAVLVSVTVRPPPITSAISNSVTLMNEQRASIEAREPPSLLGKDTKSIQCSSPGDKNAQDPVLYSPIRKGTASEPSRDLASHRSELDQKLQRLVSDFGACRSGAPVPKAKAPAPPPPTVSAASAAPNTGNRANGMLKKSYSAFVVPTPSVSSANMMTTSVNGLRSSKGTESESETVLDRSLSHDRCSSVDISSPGASDESHSSAIAKAAASRQSRSRFASIRKFLRMSESSHALTGSVRRPHLDSSSTNCSTISCSSSSNGSISFGNHIGFHSSLRKFPLLPFVMNGTKNRADLNTVRGLFHGANECRAVDEIAQDTDVVVTEINELPSTNNTLVRASKRNGAFGMPSPKAEQERSEKKGKPTNGFEHSCQNGTTNQVKHDEEVAPPAYSSVHINRLEINGQMPASPPSSPTCQPAASLPPRPPPLTAFHAKVKRTAPAVPTSFEESGEREKLALPSTDSPARALPELVDKSTDTAIWRLATAECAVQTLPSQETSPHALATMPVSSSPIRSVCSATENIKRSTFDDRYDQLVAGHLTALSHLVENFPSTTRQCRRKLSNLGVEPSKLKWTDFNVVANTPLLVTETSALYAGVLKLENKPESQSLKVDLMVRTDVLNEHRIILRAQQYPKAQDTQYTDIPLQITPLRYINPLPMPTNQHRSYFPPVVAEFQEYIPSKLIKLIEDDEEEDEPEATSATLNDRPDQQSILCKVLVLPRMMVSNIESYADHTSSRHRPQKQPWLHEKEVCFIMIQFVSALKYLQSKGVEEINADLDGFLLFRTVSSRYPQLVLSCESFSSDHTALWSRSTETMDGKEKMISSRRLRITLCQGALAALCQLLHTEIPTEELIRERHVPTFTRLTSFSEGFQKAADVLMAEKTYSLSHAKSFFEYMFWVDCEHQTGNERLFDNEQQARWWLDRERAKFVCYAMKALLYYPADGVQENGNSHNPLNASVSKLDIVDEYRAQFLMHATAKSLMEAAIALDNDNAGEVLL